MSASGDAAPSTGLHDSLRSGQVSIAHDINGKHPLQARLEKWDDTQMDFKLEGLRRTYGAGEPIRRTMEMEIVKATTHPARELLGASSVHRDILTNQEHNVDWEDVYPGQHDTVGVLDYHSQLAKKMGL